MFELLPKLFHISLIFAVWIYTALWSLGPIPGAFIYAYALAYFEEWASTPR